MLFRTISFLTGLLICCQLSAATDVIKQLEGTNYDSKQAINSKLEVQIVRWSDESEQESVVNLYEEYLQNQNDTDFVKALEEQPIKGYLRTNEITGYIIHYAWHEESQDGERLALLISPGLKSINPTIWKEPNLNPAISLKPNPDYKDFTLVEILINDDEGVVKTSLDAEIQISNDNKLTLTDFSSARDFAVIHKVN
jgi:hypothetical protein